MDNMKMHFLPHLKEIPDLVSAPQESRLSSAESGRGLVGGREFSLPE
jgi:hypothetical protein